MNHYLKVALIALLISNLIFISISILQKKEISNLVIKNTKTNIKCSQLSNELLVCKTMLNNIVSEHNITNVNIRVEDLIGSNK